MSKGVLPLTCAGSWKLLEQIALMASQRKGPAAVFTPQKVTNATNRGSLTKSWLLNMYKHATGFTTVPGVSVTYSPKSLKHLGKLLLVLQDPGHLL